MSTDLGPSLSAIPIWDVALSLSAFALGAAGVLAWTRSQALRRPPGAAAAAVRASSAGARPTNQLAVCGFDELVLRTHTAPLLRSIERRTRLSPQIFERDCAPVLAEFAEFVQMIPASECHHHAQPGGLWIHVMEVVDAALTFRCGMELPPGASTEERKRLEHRWTYATFVAALLHDVGKPVTDVRITLYGMDAHAGRAWTPLAGSMRACGGHWYSLAFADASEREYQAHRKLAAMLMHKFVPPRVVRWLSEDGDILQHLLAYLAGEDDSGLLAGIVKRADADSVRRNLLHGPRTRFSSARTRPLIERLMEALRRMLQDGGILPLNRPGAAGWVYDGAIWFVCARLAEEVRTYLSQHESLAGVPGKERNDRLFDIWQESGACRATPEGGAIWRVRVLCDQWRSPDVLTVLCFPLDRLFADPAAYPPNLRGEIQVEPTTAATTPAATTAAAPQAGEPDAAPPPAPRPLTVPSVAAVPAAPPMPPPALDTAEAADPPPAFTLSASPAPVARRSPMGTATDRASVAAPSDPAMLPAPNPESSSASGVAWSPEAAAHQGASADDDLLSPLESARLIEPAEHLPSLTASAAPAAVPLTLGAPMRPHSPSDTHPRPRRGPTPAAEAFMAWVAAAVGSGELKYNEDGAVVHFVPQGCLLLSPEVFKRFVELYRDLPEGPVAALVSTHGGKAYARLQNELAKSGWTQRNGDENLHYYAFVKADDSLSRTASFYLLPKPQLFWNPVPQPNARIRPVQPKSPKRRLSVPGEPASTGAASAAPAASSAS